MTTALTLAERAAVALQAPEHEKRLIELATKSTAIVAITNADGRAECHAARMDLKRERVAIEKLGKAARDDAQQFARAVIAEEKRLIGIIAPEEERLQTLQDAWDAERERERQAKVEAEKRRVAALQEGIGAIRRLPMRVAGMAAERIVAEIDRLHGLDIVGFDELHDEALAAKAETLEFLQLALERQREAEAEQARLAQERAELERQKAEEAARAAAERARIAEERRRAQEEQAKADAEAKARREAEEAAAKAERDRLAAEQRRLDEAARQERERLAAEQDARLAEERAAIEREKRAAALAEAKRREEAETARLAALASDPVAALREIARILDTVPEDNWTEDMALIEIVVSAALAAVEESA